jgi:CBS domain-containing protein
MCRRNVGAAVVHDPDAPGPGLITERDILRSVGAGQDADQELVAGHLTTNLTFASPEWSLEEAAAAMVQGVFRHLVVVDGGELVGILSMRDIVRVWTGYGATCEVPVTASARA